MRSGILKGMANTKMTSLVTLTSTQLQKKDTPSLDSIPVADRLVAVEREFLQRRNLDSGHKFNDPREVKAKTISLESHLTRKGIHPKDYPKVYSLALDIYNGSHGKAPFGIDYIIEAINELAPVKELPVYETKPVVCKECNDTGIKMKGLLPIKHIIEGKEVYERCKHNKD